MLLTRISLTYFSHLRYFIFVLQDSFPTPDIEKIKEHIHFKFKPCQLSSVSHYIFILLKKKIRGDGWADSGAHSRVI